MPIVIVGSVILFFFAIGLFARHFEKLSWNKGKCSKCGVNWKRFDCDSQGGRGYTCYQCKEYIWISYGVDKKYKEINA